MTANRFQRRGPGRFAEGAGPRGYDNLITGVSGPTVYHDVKSVAT